MIKKIGLDILIEGTSRTLSSNGKNILENAGDIIGEKGDKAIDNLFDPLIKVENTVSDIFDTFFSYFI